METFLILVGLAFVCGVMGYLGHRRLKTMDQKAVEDEEDPWYPKEYD